MLVYSTPTILHITGATLMNWERNGSPKVIGECYGRSLISQSFRNREARKEIDYALFQAKNASVIFPITSDGDVITVKQYRFGSCKKQTEIPSGALNDGESGLAAALRELKEETGYEPGEIINLSPNSPSGGLFVDAPAFFMCLHFVFLALDCKKTGQQKLDQEEKLTVCLIPLNEWVEMCLNGQIDDQTSLSTTFLAMGKLGVKFND